MSAWKPGEVHRFAPDAPMPSSFVESDEMAALRRFHALFERQGKWIGADGASEQAREQGADLWSVWRAAADAGRDR